MTRRGLGRLALLGASCLLAGCVDYRNVTTFADSVALVTEATGQILAADRANCAELAATVAELAAIAPQLAVDGVHCEGLSKTLDAIEGINRLLATFGHALGDVAQESFTDYLDDPNVLQAQVAGLPDRLQPTSEQAAALAGLSAWVASLATERERERTIRATLRDPQGRLPAQFHHVVALLRQLLANYAEGVETQAQVSRQVLLLVSHQYRATEPVAVAELALRWAPRTQVSPAQHKALAAYQAALDGMDHAFDAAVRNADAKDLLPEVKDFAVQARSVVRSLRDAFP